jgi:cytosine/adenosine deaminase-related metal-dependent hydrolase
MGLAPMAIYRARWLLPMSSPPIEDGSVVVRAGIVLAVGAYSDLKQEFTSATLHDLGEVVLMPGFINGHCHLDYTMMRGRLPSGSSFTSWIQGLNSIKFSLQEKEVIAAIVEGWEELGSWGSTSVINIVSFPHLLSELPPSPLRLWHLVELMDIRGREQGEQLLQIAKRFLDSEQQDKRISFGLSPHAPQTVSQGLYRAATHLAQEYCIPFCTHLAESEEEFEMFRQGEGPLFGFFKNFDRDMSDCGSQTPLQLLLKRELLPSGALLVHMNCLDAQDRELLARRGDDFFIVHTPKTHRFFDRAPFDWKFFYDHGYRLLLGTDSLASNDKLDLFSEMQLFAATAPELAPEEILKMVTLHPAEALRKSGSIGELSAGACADMIAIPFQGESSDVIEAVIHNRVKPIVIMDPQYDLEEERI